MNFISNILNKISTLVTSLKRKKINIDNLPSRGLFYDKDFSLTLKPIDKNNIINFKTSIVKYSKNPILMTRLMNKIVQLSLVEKENFEKIVSIDVMYLFILVVNISHKEKLDIEKDFKHFDWDKYKEYYNKSEKAFDIKGFKYAPPKCLIQEDVVNYILNQSMKKQEEIPEESLNFMYFIKDKKRLTPEEVENLLKIFSSDLSIKDKNLVNLIVKRFSKINRYRVGKNKQITLSNIDKLIF